jgi:hypothetical protein
MPGRFDDHCDTPPQLAVKKSLAFGLLLLLWAVISLAIALALTHIVHAKDDGRYANSPLKGWFDSLKSGKGPCCSDADGVVVKDPDWDNDHGHYRVKLDGKWIDVPDDAVITEPNRAGVTMVWPLYQFMGGQPVGLISIRCFMPGSLA